MATMDIFNQNAFSMMELTLALENVPFKQSLLRSSGLFSFEGIRTRQFAIEMRDGTLTLIPFSERGSPASQGTQDGRTLRGFFTRHFKKQDRIWASEVSGIRAFGSETEMQGVQNEVAKRGLKLRNEGELTFEYHMLQGIQGMCKNTNGDSVYNFYTEFGLTEADEIDLDLDNASPKRGALKSKCLDIITGIEDDLGGIAPGTIQVEALCGKQFWNDLTTNAEVMEAYLYAQRVANLSGQEMNGFMWGDILWKRYRSGSGVSINTDKCRFYPTNVPNLFKHYGSPPDTFDLVNTPGRDVYYRILPDTSGRNEFADVELEANPMLICTRPQALRKGRRT